MVDHLLICEALFFRYSQCLFGILRPINPQNVISFGLLLIQLDQQFFSGILNNIPFPTPNHICIRSTLLIQIKRQSFTCVSAYRPWKRLLFHLIHFLLARHTTTEEKILIFLHGNGQFLFSSIDKLLWYWLKISPLINGHVRLCRFSCQRLISSRPYRALPPVVTVSQHRWLVCWRWGDHPRKRSLRRGKLLFRRRKSSLEFPPRVDTRLRGWADRGQ